MDLNSVRMVSHAQTVPRQFVHRRSVHEVLLTDAIMVTPGSFMVGVQWPRSHVTATSRVAEVVDDLLVLETVRQIGLYLTHRYFQAPLTSRFVARELGFRWCTGPVRYAGAPVDAVAVVKMVEQRQGAGPRAGLRLKVEFLVDGSTVAIGVGQLRCLSPDLYARVRGPVIMDSSKLGHPPAGVPPAMVGRADPVQVLVAAGPRHSATGISGALRIDASHSCFFDHPQEHLPATLIAEAMRQISLLALSAPAVTVRGLHLSFARFIDLDTPTMLHGVVRDHGVDLAVEQRSAISASGHLETAAPASVSSSDDGQVTLARRPSDRDLISSVVN